jgi:glycosyltransferase involved in cell wall biosynthesis
MAEAAWKYVAGSFSWEAVAKQFEELLRQAPQWDPLRQ